MEFIIGFLVWYIVGIFSALYWPYRYHQNMRPEDWRTVLRGLPFEALLGPLAFLLCFPL